MDQKEDLIRRFQAERFRLIAYIRSFVGDADLTEDIFQQVSVVVLQKADEFIPGRDLQAWCRGIARNVIQRERQKARRLRVFEGDRILDLVDRAFEESARSDLAEARSSLMRECLDLLAGHARELVSLRYSTGLSLRQIAGKLEKSEPAVQVALSRVRKWLTDCVQRRGSEAAP
jgi:RNA polymerase sigma-70 factor (ECF subfamily)